MKLRTEEQLPRVEKGRKPTLRGKWENAFNGRQIDNFPKETCAVSPMTLYVEVGSEEKDNRLLRHRTHRQKLTGKNPSKDQAPELRALVEEGADSRVKTKAVKTRHVTPGILQYIRITSQKQDAVVARSADLDMFEAEEKPSRKSKKGGAKGSDALLKESVPFCCVSQDPHP